MKSDALKTALENQIQAGYTLIDFGCPEVKEEEKEKLRCADTTVPEDYQQCFDRSVISGTANYCCYYKLSGKMEAF